MACTVSDDTHAVAQVCKLCKTVYVLVDDNKIVTLFCESVNECIADFAGTYYDDL